MKTRIILLIGSILVSSYCWAQKETIIAFGSCDDENRPQELWPEVVKQKPELWIWGGDNIYADTGDSTNLKARYNKQKSDPGYQQLLKTCPITGTWDDHDYGMNDGGKFWPHRDIAKKMELEFLGIPKSNPVWRHPGIYNSITIGEGKDKIKVINLDTRYFRDTLVKVYYKPEGSEKKEYRYETNLTGDILGEAQWKWLQEELKNSDAALNIVNSSIQVISEEHRFEKWANFPTARRRFFDVLAASEKKILLISGDRHISEFSKISLPGMKDPLYEFLSSGLTHTWPEPWVEPNKYRIGDHVVKKSFGTISVAWGKKEFVTVLRIRGKDTQVFQEMKITFSR
ncbi:MAG TPA: alkaline phosphatase D family protein [Cyclobacteriaceae bacterium]|nr:alkaline phosphatase D family protein [Cyclobacteriaceae bacterium]